MMSLYVSIYRLLSTISKASLKLDTGFTFSMLLSIVFISYSSYIGTYTMLIISPVINYFSCFFITGFKSLFNFSYLISNSSVSLI